MSSVIRLLIDFPPALPVLRREAGSVVTGPVVDLVGIEGGVVSGMANLAQQALTRGAGDDTTKNVTSELDLLHLAIESNSHLSTIGLIRSKT
jgi:hypothetical protein